MAAPLWQPIVLPDGFDDVWYHELHTLAELATLRARLRESLTGSPRAFPLQSEHWAERMVLVVDELASNALRHGAPPAGATLSRCGDEWLIAVSDSAGDRPPEPAVGRDPASGGFGLYLIADLSQRHGWYAAGDRKVLWALLRAGAGSS